jgi:hypothetical protein
MRTRRARARLLESVDEKIIVRVRRRPKFADPLEGFVVQVGPKWALMARTSDGGFFNGFAAFRVKDVTRVARDRSFETVFSKTLPEWPPSYPGDLDLDSVAELIRGLGKGGDLLSVEKEKERSAMWIGRLDEVTRRFVYLHEVRPDASWHPAPRGYKLRAITNVGVRTQYLVGLTAIAGDAPGGHRPSGAS